MSLVDTLEIKHPYQLADEEFQSYKPAKKDCRLFDKGIDDEGNQCRMSTDCNCPEIKDT